MYTEGSRERVELASLIKGVRVNAPTPSGRRMTQQRFAEMIGFSQGHIPKIERAVVKIEPATVERIIDVFEVDLDTAGRMRLLAARNAVGVPFSGEQAREPRYVREYLDTESRAVEILSWHELRIPGPLQSEPFMLAQFGAADTIDVAPLFRSRMARRDIFGRPDLRRYDCVIAEEALHRAYRALGAMVVCDEIDYLIGLNDAGGRTDDADVAVHLLPTSTGILHMYGDFSILGLADPNNDFVYIEHVCGAHYRRAARDLAKARETWDGIHRTALDRVPTNVLLRKLREEFASG